MGRAPHRLRVGVVRAIIETTVLAAGVLLGGAVGIGTILFAFGIGPAVEVAFRLLRVEVPSRKAAGDSGGVRAMLTAKEAR